MIIYKTQEEVELIRKSALLVSKTLAQVGKLIRAGSTSKALDELAEQFIRDHGGIPVFKGYHGFPASLCVSVNSMVVHGIPNDRPFEEGDIISVDCGVRLNGYVGDSAYTFGVGELKPEVANLLKVTKESLYKGIEQVKEGNRTGDIGNAVQKHAEKAGYGVVRELVGHGVGKELHEKPEVPNYGNRGSGAMLKSGMVIAIEPMINMGKRNIVQESDGWTIRTSDYKPSAHFEHTVAVTKEGYSILSSFEEIEEANSIVI